MQWSLERAAGHGAIRVTKSSRHFPAGNERFTLISRGKETAGYHLCSAIQRVGGRRGARRKVTHAVTFLLWRNPSQRKGVESG